MRPPKEAEMFTFDEILQTRPPSISAPGNFDAARTSSNSQRAKHTRNASHGGNPPQGNSQTVSGAQPSSPWKSAFSALTESPPSFQPEFDTLAPPDNVTYSAHEPPQYANHKKHRSARTPDSKMSSKRGGVTHLRLYSASGFPLRPDGSATGSFSAPHTPTNAAVPWKLFHRKPGYKEFVVESPQNSPHEVYYNPNDVNLRERYPDSNRILANGVDDTNAEYINPASRSECVQQRLPRLSLSVTSTQSAPQMPFSLRAASGRQSPKRPSLRLMSHEEFAEARLDSAEGKDSDSPARAPSTGKCTSNSGVRLRLALANLSEKRESRESSFTEEAMELLDADTRARSLSAPAGLEVSDHRGADRECASVLSAVKSSEACIHSSHSNPRNSLNFPTDTAATSHASKPDGEVRSKGSITNVAGDSSPVNLSSANGNSPVPSNLSRSSNNLMNSSSLDGISSASSSLTGGNSPVNSSSTNGNGRVPSRLYGANSSSANSSAANDSNSAVSPSVGDIDNASSNFTKARNVFLSVAELNEARTKARASHRIRSSRANFRLRVRPRQHLSRVDTSSSNVSWSHFLEQQPE